jgi:hypothetical protein
VARAVISDPRRRTAYEPLYDIDAQTGASVEVFYADCALAGSFGAASEGWFWWACQPGCLPGAVAGPFTSNYLAYRDALGDLKSVARFGKRRCPDQQTVLTDTWSPLYLRTQCAHDVWRSGLDHY